jgi:hypothetical protein
MRLLFLAVAAALSLHADVTLRYKIDSNPAAALPPGVDSAPVLRMKGAKGVTTLGRLTAIIDTTTRELTLIDPDRKTYATFPIAEYASKNAPKMAEAAKMMPKFDTKSRKTGRIQSISGIQTEETAATLGMDFGGASVSIDMHVWTATQAEVLRVPAIRELTALDLWLQYFLKFGDEFEMPNVNGLLLRMEMQVHAKAPNIDASKSIFNMTMDTAELSTAAIPDSAFQVPEGFTARPAEELMQNTTAPAIVSDSAVQAFVPHLDPLEKAQSESTVSGMVRLIVTIGPDGKVLDAEPIAGPEALRKLAVEDVRKFKYRPVLRDGKPATAMTEATLFFGDGVGAQGFADGMTAYQRVAALQEKFPRTPQQAFADLENDLGDRRDAVHLTDLAKAALDAEDLTKAETYANAALSDKADANDIWNAGNRVHYGHIVLGRVALRRGDVAAAAQHLIAAGKTKGSPQLNSFGPDFVLAKELFAKGETGAVVEYLDECRAFWTMAGSRLDSWKADIRAGKTPKM